MMGNERERVAAEGLHKLLDGPPRSVPQWRRPIVVHVSGAPAAGKSTLGERLSERFIEGLAVIDTDSFIQYGMPEKDELEALSADPGAYLRRWRELLARKFVMALEEHWNFDVLVFVGLLDHCGPPGAEPYKLSHADFKYFLDVPPLVLLRQYYSRLAFSEDLLSEAVRGRLVIPSSSVILQEACTYRKWHARNGYTLSHSEAIVAALDSLLRDRRRKA